ncbi:sensor histidine kinase [Streptomyces smyrnaeus]|uniref:sensor histidine kinase n=1 Tax=Streptomyces TaxID=1883 RepID=UPI000C1A0324|nr:MULTISPECIES: histidine kinase [unclassified Streptomyces]MBQ0865019.1 histidine kinase [Streptomyces sp. RK75]MBQ1123690.1 histidine kinase [Streptomyces sp. B15]
MTGRPPGRGRVRTFALRWVHLLQGGALLMPFYLLVSVGISIVRPGVRLLDSGFGPQFLAFALCLPLVALAGLLPVVRALESAAARTLCELPGGTLALGPAGSWAARRRSAVWFPLHIGLGGLVSGASLAIPPAAAVLLAFPFVPALRSKQWAWPWDHEGGALWTAPVAGVALLVALIAAVHVSGDLLARCAPVLLGPTPADRLAAAERRAADLAARNRLARELHDSVGHALSAVSLQAGAARRVLDDDPRFVREALAAIEETSRGAVAELDAVLGVLRAGESAPAAGPSLAAGLETLVARSRATGTDIRLRVDDALGPLALLDAQVSAESYRVVQEGLSNALRHAPGAAVDVRLERQRSPQGELLAVTVENAASGTGRSRPSGGRGLAGIAERAALLGGTARADNEDGVWRLTARLPLSPADSRQQRPEAHGTGQESMRQESTP